MPAPDWFAQRAQALGGTLQAIGAKGEAVRVVIERESLLIVIEGDRTLPDRVTIGCEVPRVRRVDDDSAAAVATDFTTRRALLTGCVVGYNPDLHLMVLGQSRHQTEVEGREEQLVATLLAEYRSLAAELASVGQARFDQLVTDIGRAGQRDDQ